MKLGQYINWDEQTNTCTGDLKESHVVADALPGDYADITSIENWDKFGKGLIGSAYQFKDWKCLQREIKSLVLERTSNNINTNWNSLNDAEKLITCTYLLSKVSPASLVMTIPDAEERMNIAIDFDVNNRAARGSWLNATGRIQIMRIFLFGKIGTANALKVFSDVAKDGLLELYEGGISGTLEDGNTGLNDFLLARPGTGYESTGLAARDYIVIDESGDTVNEVAIALVDIANDGIY